MHVADDNCRRQHADLHVADETCRRQHADIHDADDSFGRRLVGLSVHHKWINYTFVMIDADNDD